MHLGSLGNKAIFVPDYCTLPPCSSSSPTYCWAAHHGICSCTPLETLFCRRINYSLQDRWSNHHKTTKGSPCTTFSFSPNSQDWIYPRQSKNVMSKVCMPLNGWSVVSLGDSWDCIVHENYKQHFWNTSMRKIYFLKTTTGKKTPKKPHNIVLFCCPFPWIQSTWLETVGKS